MGLGKCGDGFSEGAAVNLKSRYDFLSAIQIRRPKFFEVVTLLVNYYIYIGYTLLALHLVIYQEVGPVGSIMSPINAHTDT
jgi:hypothetical protein